MAEYRIAAGPTDQYEKLDALDVTSTDDAVNLRLRAKGGVEFDPEAIARCLDHTIAKIVKPKV